MPGGCVDDFLTFVVTLEQFRSDSRVSAFHFVVGCFSNVVKKPTASTERRIKTDLVTQQASNVRNLD